VDDIDRLHQAAQHFLAVADRVLGSYRQGDDAGDVVSQISRGEWDDRFVRAGAATDAAAALTAAAEQLKQLRRDLDRIAQPDHDPRWDPSYKAVSEAVGAWLPGNRKERFFTGTVLPMVAMSDGFAHTGRLLALCGLPDIDLAGLEGDNRVQVFTEYSFAESVFLAADRERFADRPAAADTPDLVLVGDGWLLAIEAKLYDASVSTADLRRQLDAQAVLVEYWREKLALEPDRVRHVALLPRRLATRIGASLGAPIVLWEDVADAYRNVAPRYWIAVLEHALAADLYGADNLAFGANAHAQMTGAEIVAAAHVPDGAVHTVMGRNGGINGKLLAADVATGAWRTQSYEVRTDGIPNRNWFLISDFLDLLGDES